MNASENCLSEKQSARLCAKTPPKNELLTRPKCGPIDESGGEESAAIPGLSYVGGNHNLSNSRGRPLEHLRGARTETKPPLQLLEKETDNGHVREKCNEEGARRADLRLINCWHEGVQGDDDKSVWKTAGQKRVGSKWMTLNKHECWCSKQSNHSITLEGSTLCRRQIPLSFIEKLCKYLIRLKSDPIPSFIFDLI